MIQISFLLSSFRHEWRVDKVIEFIKLCEKEFSVEVIVSYSYKELFTRVYDKCIFEDSIAPVFSPIWPTSPLLFSKGLSFVYISAHDNCFFLLRAPDDWSLFFSHLINSLKNIVDKPTRYCDDIFYDSYENFMIKIKGTPISQCRDKKGCLTVYHNLEY